MTVGEPYPEGSDRLLRTGLLARELARRRHEVTWWGSTFDHVRKVHRTRESQELVIDDDYRMVLLHGCGYRRNASLRRVIDHVQVARQFGRLSTPRPPPDVLLCSMPTIELAARATAYATSQRVPILLDIRDLWPDMFVHAVPRWARRPVALVASLWRAKLRRAIRESTGLLAVSADYLSWGLRLAGRPERWPDAVFPLAYDPPPLLASLTRDAARRALAQYGVGPDDVVCWFVGTFGRTYDLHTVIEAARLLEERGQTTIRMLISGDGEYGPALREAARDVSTVRFTGWLDREGIAYLMQGADVGVACYVSGAPQSLPNKVIEYWSASLPVASSLGGETAELIREHQCGFTYSPGDPHGLADLLQRFCASRAQLRAAGQRGHRLYEQRFDARVVYPRLADHLEAVARGSPAGPSSISSSNRSL